MRGFYPTAPGAPGIRMAYFNLREGRFRQSNLHLIRPARIGNRHYIDEMYEHRHQREFGQILALAWRLLRSERGGLRGAGLLPADAPRRPRRPLGARGRGRRPAAPDPDPRASSAASPRCSRGAFRLIVTEAGGCAVDIDTEHDFDAAKLCFDELVEGAARARGARLRRGRSAAPRSRRARARALSVGDAALTAVAVRRGAGLFRLRERALLRGARRRSRALARRHAEQRRRAPAAGPPELRLLCAAALAAGPHPGRLPRAAARRRAVARDGCRRAAPRSARGSSAT